MSNRPNRRNNRPPSPSETAFMEGLRAQQTQVDRYAYITSIMQKAALTQTLYNAIYRADGR